jgi:hypothetical protein
MSAGQYLIIPDSGEAATDPGSRTKGSNQRPWTPAFAGEQSVGALDDIEFST